jgi:hypothetical protein
MTVLYLSIRYLGILYAALAVLVSVPNISLTDTGCYIIYTVLNWTGFVVFVMLWVIIITRLHAMYQPSRKILIFLIIIFLAFNIFDGVVAVMTTMHTSGDIIPLLNSITWILVFVLEILALCHAVWTAIKHFRELRQHSAGTIIGDCFTMLIKTHMAYFASMADISCFTFIFCVYPTFAIAPPSLANQVDFELLQVSQIIQMFVLGPRLILSIREYHAKLVADSDAATSMTSIAFEERVDISTSSSV